MWMVFLTAGVVSPTEERVQVALEEMHDLKGVWQELAKVWEKIDELKEKPWLSVQPRKVKFVRVLFSCIRRNTFVI